MSAKHTPGPWLAAAGPSSIVGWPVVGSGGRAIASLTWWPREHFQPDVTDEAYDALVAEIGANARLIAAAPDLLEALQSVMSAHGEQLHDAFDDAHKAISKALGSDQ